MMDPEKYLKDPDVWKVEHPCKGIWFIRYDDGSVTVKDDYENTIQTPLNRFDVVQELKFLGTYKGFHHFVYKACEYGSRNHPEYGIFDSRGHRKLFKDPRLMGLDSVDKIAAEFEKIVKAAQDKNNPRRDDSMLWDLDKKVNLGIRR